MRIEFEKIRLRDFKEYRGKHVLALSDLGKGLHFIRGLNQVDAIGSNGAGKTTLWDAFMWTLTGKTTRGLRGTDVRTWGGKEHAEASVSFWADEDGHVIKRSTVKNGLWLDGKLTSQEEIDRLIGLNAITIPHTILLAQKRELFFDLEPSKKMQILASALDLERWDFRSKLAKETASDLATQMDKLDATTRQIERDLDSTRDTMDDITRKSQAWERERSSGAEERANKIAKLKKARDKLDLALGDFDLAYDGAETELRALRRDIAKVMAEYQTFAEKEAEKKAQLRELERRLGSLEAIDDVCPTCGQEIANAKEARKHRKKEVQAIEEEHFITDARMGKWRRKKEEAGERLAIMRKSEKDFGEKSDAAKDKYDQHKARIAELDKEMAVLKAQSREDETNPYEETIRTCRDQIKRARKLVAEQKELGEKLHARHVRHTYWIKGFKDIKLFLIEELLQELTEATQVRLPEMGLAGWSVQYDMERETKDGNVSTGLNVSILKPGMTKPVRWEAWSGGENQRLLIAGALSLSDVLLRNAGVDCDMIVLDEPTRHMSDEGVSDLVEHLIQMGKDRQVFYCDHAAIENSRFAHVITITKDAQGSRIDVD